MLNYRKGWRSERIQALTIRHILNFLKGVEHYTLHASVDSLCVDLCYKIVVQIYKSACLDVNTLDGAVLVLFVCIFLI